MGRISLEPYDKTKHRNHMPELCKTIVSHGQVIVIEQGRYRLEFLSLEQLKTAISYFSKKDGGSTRLNASGGDHWEFQSWQSRLPAGINNKHHRDKILNLLRVALDQYGHTGGYHAACT